ncbi:uncharacterized protein CYBJADRAFT_138883 [Cyberlindnera jadinii NRRL Y-1542]|uniref:Uncharacterized protein n=1 Tax=Cyberlindnera jadinii (strain ATCC 18201 / CBS 1600 / BCRC 20928 / JCM 3617 / NBRC 0987 / NRRL Y-1542) TaxID=983966 RepID=A0A1E4S1Z5_CYBJN|nr:hypothetical protein CYBJADRAFT_138883 [Cyberlindnera jadinii NRRL Y-1542]ODV73503.1 hypothetical protein CYBJADRAFT_138883 [Cyberlindnera jadinii NRRL Y-1542]
MADAAKIVNVVLALLLPPLAVFLVRGAGRDLLINCICCCKYNRFPPRIRGVFTLRFGMAGRTGLLEAEAKNKKNTRPGLTNITIGFIWFPAILHALYIVLTSN